LPRTKFEISGLLWILHLQKLCNYSPTLPLVRLDVPHVLRVLQLQQNPKVLSIDLLRPAVTRVEHGQLADETKKTRAIVVQVVNCTHSNLHSYCKTLQFCCCNFGNVYFGNLYFGPFHFCGLIPYADSLYMYLGVQFCNFVYHEKLVQLTKHRHRGIYSNF